MNDPALRRQLPSTPGIVAGVLVTAGILLWMFVSRGLLVVAGLGAFGPGVLREVGWLKDQDEFQRQAAHRAGYHAYLVGGLAAVSVLALLEWSSTTVEDAAEWIRFIVFVLWLTWLFSSLLSYWGARVTASRLLQTVGLFWAVFVIASLAGNFHIPRTAHEVRMGLEGLGAGILFVAPFFVLARTVHRRPRPTGIALLGVSAILLLVLGGRRQLQWSTVVMTRTLLVGPMLATGIAVLRDARSAGDGGGAEERAQGPTAVDVRS